MKTTGNYVPDLIERVPDDRLAGTEAKQGWARSV